MVTNGEVFRINHPDAKLIKVGSDIVGVKIGDDITCYDKNWWNKKAKGVTDEIEKLASELPDDGLKDEVEEELEAEETELEPEM